MKRNERKEMKRKGKGIKRQGKEWKKKKFAEKVTPKDTFGVSTAWSCCVAGGLSDDPATVEELV